MTEMAGAARPFLVVVAFSVLVMWQCSNAYEQCEIDGNLGAARQLSRKGEMLVQREADDEQNTPQ